MSMPQYFNVAVISDRHPGGPELALAAAAVLRQSDDDSGIAPYILAASTYTRCRPAVIRACLARSAVIAGPVSASLLNPQRVDLWLALDESGETTARVLIDRAGPAPVGYYRDVFPAPVVHLDCALPDPPQDESFDPWLDSVAEQLAAWKKQIWDAFYLSS